MQGRLFPILQPTTLVIVCSVVFISKFVGTLFVFFWYFLTFFVGFCCFWHHLKCAKNIPFAANNTCHCFLSCKHCEGSSGKFNDNASGQCNDHPSLCILDKANAFMSLENADLKSAKCEMFIISYSKLYFAPHQK